MGRFPIPSVWARGHVTFPSFGWHDPDPHRPFAARRRLHPFGRGGARRRGRRGGLAAPGHHGRALRAQHLLRPRPGEGAAARLRHAFRRAPDDRAGRSLPGRLRRGGGAVDLRASGGRAAPAPVAADDPRAGLQGGGGAEPGDAGGERGACAGAVRPPPGDDGQSGLRRAILPSLAAGEDRDAAADDRRERAGDRPAGGWRRDRHDGAAVPAGRGRCAGGRHRGVRGAGLPGGDRRAARGGVR